MVWRARIEGHEFDVKWLADRFSEGQLTVRPDKDGYSLSSVEFDTMTDSSDVLKSAAGIIAVLNGLLRLHG